MHDTDAPRRHDPLDRAIGRIAESQYGVISRAQLSELAVGRGAVWHRIEAGRLHPIHRGVYAVVGPRLLTQRGRWMAAVLACGRSAVLSHLAAAWLWGIRRSSRVEVTVPRGRRPRPGIHLHWANLPADETTTHLGIPTTNVPRTLLDLSAVVQLDELRGAMRQAEQLRLTDRLWLGDPSSAIPERPGSPPSEPSFISAGLPLPNTNVLIEGYEVDCVWPEARLIVELDSRTHHAVAEAFEADRARDRRLEASGWRVVRITWR
jgi:hypothetical protein